MCRGDCASMAVCGRVSKEWCADPVRTQGGPSPDPAKRGADFGVAECDYLSHVWGWSGGVFSGVISGRFRGWFSGAFWGWFWRSISGAFSVGLVSPFRTVKSGAAARDRARVRRGDL